VEIAQPVENRLHVILVQTRVGTEVVVVCRKRNVFSKYAKFSRLIESDLTLLKKVLQHEDVFSATAIVRSMHCCRQRQAEEALTTLIQKGLDTQ
jgi:16S rRNA G1207 methylase RsmC